MNNSSIVTTTFCRKCKKLRSCLETNAISDYRYLCKQCTKEEDLLVTCINCGREATTDILKHGGYCHLCERENISEVSCRSVQRTLLQKGSEGALGKLVFQRRPYYPFVKASHGRFGN